MLRFRDFRRPLDSHFGSPKAYARTSNTPIAEIFGISYELRHRSVSRIGTTNMVARTISQIMPSARSENDENETLRKVGRLEPMVRGAVSFSPFSFENRPRDPLSVSP